MDLEIVMPLYAGVTQLDFTGPHQFFSRLPGARVIAASLGAQPISADGLVFSGLQDLAKLERCDVLCVPGGYGCIDMIENEDFLAAIKRLAASARYVGSVCTGSLILGAAGLLRGRRATCHWAWRDMLEAIGAIPEKQRVVQDGNLITGGGVTAGIDFALTVIAELAGIEAAQTVQLVLEYAPKPPFASGTPEEAPARIVEWLKNRLDPALASKRLVVERVAKPMG